MIRILLVDDDPLVRSGLRFIFTAADDVEVVGEASDGAAAVEAARELDPDLVLMDLRMAGLDGRAATERLVRLPRPPRVLILTTFDLDAHLMSALDAGASGYLLKDTPPLEIIEAIRQTVRGDVVLSARHTRVLLDRYAADGAHPRRDDARSAVARLTDRERQVVTGVARGFTNTEIGELLSCSPATVKAHLANVFVQLHLQNRVQLAILASDAGLLEAADGPGGCVGR